VPGRQMEKTEPFILPDASARASARGELGRNVVVEAAAGTGKTRLLIERICCYLLTRPGADIRKIVALTFTEKAAAEIRVRLSAYLTRAAAFYDGGAGEDTAMFREMLSASGVSPAKMAERARACLLDMDKAVIGTIHSFASHILRLFPLEAGVDPASEVDSGAGFSGLFEREWTVWIERELSSDAPRERLWLEVLADFELEDMRSLAAALCEARFEDYRPEFFNLACAKTIRDQFAVRAASLVQAHSEGRRSGAVDALEASAAALHAYADFLEGRREKPLPYDDALDSSITMTLKGWEREDLEFAKRAAAVAKAACAENHYALRRAFEAVDDFAVRFRALYAREGLISFDGLLIRARDLVRGNPAVRNRLKAKFSAFFIDEFQDTDPLQGELFLFLCEKADGRAGRWQDAELEPGKLFVVGDPKQSIYRFRGADIKAYQDFIAHMKRHGALECRLQVNFRSAAPLIALVNRAMEPVMKPRAGYQPDYVPLIPRPGENSAGPLAEMALLPKESGEDVLGAAEARKAQAAYAAGWILKNRGGRPFRDFAMLFRKNTSLDIWLDALKSAGIPYVVDEDSYFYGTQEACDMANLLSLIDNPRDRIALAGLLRSPLAGLTDRRLYELHAAGGLDTERAAPDGFPEVERFYSIIRTLRERAADMRVWELFEAALEALGAEGLLPLAYHRQQTLANMAKMKRKALEASAEGLTLSAFIARLRADVRDGAREGEDPVADESVDAVVISTIHKAKGLEYPVVIIPDIASGGRARGGREGAVMSRSWGDGLCGMRAGRRSDAASLLLEAAEAPHAEEEEKRILYVALTRAREKILFIGTLQRPRSSGFSMAGYLRAGGLYPVVEKDAQPSDILKAFSCDAGLMTVSSFSAGEDADLASAQVVAGTLQCGMKDMPSWSAAWKARSREYEECLSRRISLSPSSMIAEKRGEPLEDLSELEFVEKARLAGLICHKALELHSFPGPFSDAEIRRAAAMSCPETMSARADEASAEALSVLRAFENSSTFRLFSDYRILGREMPFSLSRADGTVVRGVMDAVLEKDGRLLIADYKSERVRPGEGDGPAKFLPQAEIYREAARAVFGADADFCLVYLRTGDVVPIQ